MGNAAHAPVYRRNVYSRSAIVDPYPHYAALRELGPVVWLSRQRVYALPRYAECKAVLRDDANFVSGQGVALDRLTNRMSRGTTLNSDGDDHQRRRKLLAHRLTPRRCARWRGRRREGHGRRRGCDRAPPRRRGAQPGHGTADGDRAGSGGVARERPREPVAVGGGDFRLPGPAEPAVAAHGARRRADAEVRATGGPQPKRARGQHGPRAAGRGGRGKLSHAECPPLMIDYIAPSLDTTISAISSALHLFATHPEQWQTSRATRR